MMGEHLRAVVWPREPLGSGEKKAYRYIIVGWLITKEPIEKFEGRNEIIVDGYPGGLRHALEDIRENKAPYPLGEASSALFALRHMPIDLPDEDEFEDDFETDDLEVE